MIFPDNLHVVILTGSRQAHGPLLAGTGLRSKPLLPVGGESMLASVLKAVAASDFAARLWVSTQDPQVLALSTEYAFEVIPNASGAVRSLLKALRSLPEDGEWVLFVSGDHPLLTPDMLNYFVREGLRKDLALVVAVVERSVVQAAYPESQRTYFHARDGAFSGGNLFLINRRKFQANVTVMETIDANRKKPWKNAFMLNPLSLLKILCRQLTMSQVAQEASRLLRCPTDVVVMPFAECCMDVDKPSDKALAEEILKRRQIDQSGIPSQLGIL
jgi:molybdopterin-guanine dinucleotide biosynthesis protein A